MFLRFLQYFTVDFTSNRGSFEFFFNSKIPYISYFFPFIKDNNSVVCLNIRVQFTSGLFTFIFSYFDLNLINFYNVNRYIWWWTLRKVIQWVLNENIFTTNESILYFPAISKLTLDYIALSHCGIHKLIFHIMISLTEDSC